MPQALDCELKNLVRLVGNVTDAFTVALFLVDDQDEDILRLSAFQSLSNNVIKNASIPVGRGLVGWVAKNGRATHATNYDRDTKTLWFYSKDEEIKSFAAAPVFDGDRVIGVLSIDSKQHYIFTNKIVKLLSDFTCAISSAIVHGRHRIKLDSEAVAFEALSDIIDKVSVCEKFAGLAHTLKMNMGAHIRHDQLLLAVRSLDDDGFCMVRVASTDFGVGPEPVLPLTHYRLGWVIGQGRPIRIPDLKGVEVYPGSSGKWRSFIGAPVMAMQNAIGAIGLVSANAKAFRNVDLKSLAILASSLSSAFEGLRFSRKKQIEAQTDPVTGMISHQSLLDNRPFLKGAGAVLMLNIVGFTQINIRLGFEDGENVLRETAERIAEAVGVDGVVSRYYGKFIILLENASRDEVVPKIKSIVEAVDGAPFFYGGYDIHVSTAVGAALYPADGLKLKELILKAQEAAERARRASGARISLHGEPETDRPVHLRSVKEQEI